MSDFWATSASSVIASIPSPSRNSLELGPFTLTFYGLMIGFGIIAAAYLVRPRTVARNMHPDTVFELLVWVIPAGIVGARVYHLITDWVPFQDWHKIWEGGLGIPGGILAGVGGGLLFISRRGYTRSSLLDAAIPGVPLAQAIGRWGNWWNQELYGEPTTLPWGLEIDEAHRVAGFSEFETFHPTFLYESLWNLGLVGLLLWLDRKQVLKPGRLIWVYAAGYAIGRLWIEALRIDNATEIFGVRINLWTMGTLLVVAAAVLSRSFGRDDTSDASALNDDHAEDSAAAKVATSDEEE